jgi:membrane protein
VVESLSAARLLRSLAGGGLVPARPLERISLADVRAAVHGPAPKHPETGPVALDRVLEEVDAETDARLGRITLRALCDEERARLQGAAGGQAGAEEGPAQAGGE